MITEPLTTSRFSLALEGKPDALWSYTTPAGHRHAIAAPAFEIDGQVISAAASQLTALGAQDLPNGATEHVFRGPLDAAPDLTLDLHLRIAADSPVVRFRYRLHSRAAHSLTKREGCDYLCYAGASFAAGQVSEVRLSEFNEQLHSYTLSERDLDARHFDQQLGVVGPLLVAAAAEHSFLLAYEHGAQAPDAYVGFELAPDRSALIVARKGNYYAGQALGPDAPYTTIWLEFAAVDGDRAALASAYRRFALDYLATQRASRSPLIFYNTWNYQERNKWWSGKPYLSEMTEARMLAEIDVASRMGIDVFVIDTGWYAKTGDWRPSRERFPNGLAPIRERLQRYGMRLGLWFNPTAAALSSDMHAAHRGCITEQDGRQTAPRPIWETESSQPLCLVSQYADAFAAQLIRLARDEGVRYFKWDAIAQASCDAAGHGHGTADNSALERRDSYAFQQVRAMVQIVEQLQAACPEAIVDFDITEAGRSVGLAWLSAGKYFLINNGPYYMNYDIPIDRERQNWNMFFYPGPARTWICRSTLDYDRWLPSVLFLSHYFPDDPAESQLIGIASLILGHNGIWGDLLSVSDAGIERFAALLGAYKRVRDDITRAELRRSGPVGGSPEVYEKIDSATGRGAVVLFALAPGSYTYLTTQRPVEAFVSFGARVQIDSAGYARIDATFERPSAAIVLFGA